MMHADPIIWLTFISTSLGIVALWRFANDFYFEYRKRLRNRLNELSPQAVSKTSVWSNARNSIHGKSAPEQSWWEKCESLREQAGIKTPLIKLFITAVALPPVVGIVVFYSTGISVTGIAAGMLAGCAVPAYVYYGRRRRQRKLLRQVPESLNILARAVRAGQTTTSALQIVADECQAPISEEFRRCYEQQNLGLSLENALRELAARTGVMELRILVVALLVQSRSGGNLVELLTNLSAVVQKRLKLEQRVSALTSEGRLQAAILIVLPLLAFLALHIFATEYVMVLWLYPKVLSATIVAQLLGALWIQRCLRFDY